MENASNPWKAAFITLITITLGTILLVGGWLYLQSNQTKTPSSSTSQEDTAQTSQTPTQTTNKTTVDLGIPIGSNTISFTRSGTNVYLKYKNKLYEEDKNGQVQQTNVNLLNATWYGLVNTPENATGFDEIFSFRTIPDSKNFIFVIRYDIPIAQNQTKQEVKLYYYNPQNPSETVSLLFSAVPTDPANKEASYPITALISPDGTHASFNMFSCWNCGGHEPETMVVNLNTKTTKRIGKTSYFTWKQNGAYEYKEYVAIPCPTPTGTGEFMQVDCPKDPAKLPLKTGSI